MKSLSFLSPLEKEALRAAIEEEAAAVSESTEESGQEAPAIPPPTKDLCKLLELLADNYTLPEGMCRSDTIFW